MYSKISLTSPLLVVMPACTTMALREKMDAYRTLFDVDAVVALHGEFVTRRQGIPIVLNAMQNVLTKLGTRNAHIDFDGSSLHIGLQESVERAALPNEVEARYMPKFILSPAV